MLTSKGLNYGQLPKGLLLFHNYEDGPRTPMEEHLVEAALYAESNGSANIHFTLSHNHLELFSNKVHEKVDSYGKKLGVRLEVVLSEHLLIPLLPIWITARLETLTARYCSDLAGMGP